MTLNRLQAPDLFEISKINLPIIEKQNLDNGIPICIINTGSQELVKVQISFPAGTIYQNNALTAFFTNKLLAEGSKKFSAATIAEKMDFYGAFIDTKISRDQAYVNIFSLNKHLNDVLEVVADLLLNPSMPQNELDTLIEQEKHNFSIKMQKVKTIAQREFNTQLFGSKHPYGTMSSLSDYGYVEMDGLKSFFNQNYQQKDWQIFVSGKVEKETLEILNQHFGINRYEGYKLEKPIVEPSESLTPKAHFIEHKGAMQTALRMGKLSIDRKHKDYPILSLAQTVLGGFFGSRLMQNIREDKGYTYGIHSMIIHLQQASIFSISSEVGSQFAEKALGEVHKELKILRTEEVKEEELTLVKNYMAGSLLKSLNGPFALGEMMRMIHEYHLSEDFFTQYISSIQQASSQDVLKVADKYLNEEEMMSVMVGSI